MRKLRRLPKPSMLRVKHPKRRSLNRRDNAGRNPPVFSREGLRLRNRAFHHLRLLDHVAMLFLVSIRNAQQHAPKARTPISIARRKISPAIKGLSIRRKKRG